MPENGVISEKRVEKITEGDFKSDSPVQFFQQGNDEVSVNFKTVQIPVAKKLNQAEEKTFKKIRDKSHFYNYNPNNGCPQNFQRTTIYVF